MTEKETKKMPQIDQMKILYERAHAAFHVLGTLHDDDRLDDLAVTWRLGSIVGMLDIFQSEVKTAIIIMECEMEKANVPALPETSPYN